MVPKKFSQFYCKNMKQNFKKKPANSLGCNQEENPRNTIDEVMYRDLIP